MFNFLKKLFGNNPKTVSQNKSRTPPKKGKTWPKGILLKTNAPSNWPQIKSGEDAKMFPEGDNRNWLTSSLLHAGKILTALKTDPNQTTSSSYKDHIDLVKGDLVVSSSVQQLTSEGVLKIDVALRHQNKKYGIIVFEKAINRPTIEKIKALLIPYAYDDFIWYAPEIKEEATKDQIQLPIMELDKTSFSVIKDFKPKHSQYAMWWSSPKEKYFSSSDTCNYINEFYELIDGYETSFNGLFGVMLGLHPKIDRVTLPENLVVPMQGPGGEEILLGISEKKGFNFYFPVSERTALYRDHFLKEMIPFAKTMLELMKKHNYQSDHWQNMPIEWWQNRVELAKQKEATQGQDRLITLVEPLGTGNPIFN